MPTTLTSTNSRTVTPVIGTDVASAAAGPRSIWRPGVVAGLAAAAVTTLIAVAARAAAIIIPVLSHRLAD